MPLEPGMLNPPPRLHLPLLVYYFLSISYLPKAYIYSID